MSLKFFYGARNIEPIFNVILDIKISVQCGQIFLVNFLFKRCLPMDRVLACIN